MKNDSLVNDEMEEYRLAAQIYVARSFTATSLTSNGVDLNKISLNPQFSQRWISIMKQGDCDFDDASTDGTGSLEQIYPQVEWIFSEELKGYLYARNKLMSETDADVYCSLDEDSWPQVR